MAAFKARPKRAICICCLRYGRTFKRGLKPYLRPRFKRGRSLYLKPRLKRGLRTNGWDEAIWGQAYGRASHAA